jgi:hypothetical protein
MPEESLAVSGSNPFCVGPGQSTNLFYRIVPMNDNADKHQQTHLFHTHNYLIKPSADESAPPPLFPEFDLLNQEGLCTAAEKKKNVKDKREIIATESALDLVLLWETTLNDRDKDGGNGIVLRGQHNLCDVSFLMQTVDKVVSAENNSSNNATDNASLRFSIESPRKVIHDFSKEGYLPFSFSLIFGDFVSFLSLST